MTSAADSRARLFLWAAAGVVLFLAAAAAIVLSALPDVPGWVLWALGKVKFVLIAAFGLAVAVRELRRGRGA
jgi:hypothetical protein